MSDFEILTVMLTFVGIITVILIEYIKKQPPEPNKLGGHFLINQ